MAQPETITIEDPCYIVIEKGASPFNSSDIIMEREQYLCAAYDKKFSAGIGAEGVRTLLEKMDMDLLCAALREEVSESTGQKKRKLIKRLQVAEDFEEASQRRVYGAKVLPVIPRICASWSSSMEDVLPRQT